MLLLFLSPALDLLLTVHSFPDRVRGVMNEGGLFGEREGWHLPGFDTSSWESRDLSAGLPNATAGVGFFVTTFELGLPAGFDVQLSFDFDNNTLATDVPYRTYLFVNGWMMGKRVGNLGPQTSFPVHEGILEYNATKCVAHPSVFMYLLSSHSFAARSPSHSGRWSPLRWRQPSRSRLTPSSTAVLVPSARTTRRGPS
jgi:hypothetical protein